MFMKKCVMCDRMEPDSAVSCSACGSYLLPLNKQKNNSTSWNCASCGKKNDNCRNNCVNCGTQRKTSIDIDLADEAREMGEGHGVCLVGELLVTIFSGYLAYAMSSGEDSALIPRLRPDEICGLFFLAAVGICIFSAIIFLGLCGKMSWAGRLSYWPLVLPAIWLATAETWGIFVSSETSGLLSSDHSSLLLWIVVAGLTVIGLPIDRYYRDNEECMN